jgi:hypothetical protein
VTDAEGAAQVELPKTFSILRLWAGKKPYVRLGAGWEKAELASGRGVPPEYTFRLETTGSASGRVVDENGKPVSGATVQIQLANDPKPVQGDGRAGYQGLLAWLSDAPTTDAEGRWRVDNVPDHPGVELSFLVSHPDYVTDDEAKTVRGVLNEMNCPGVTPARRLQTEVASPADGEGNR